MLLDDVVFLQQGGIDRINKCLGFCALLVQLCFLALGFLFIFGLQLIKCLFRVGSFHADDLLLLFMSSRFFNNTGNFSFILANGIPAVAHFRHQGLNSFSGLRRIRFETIFQGLELGLGMGDRLFDDIFTIRDEEVRKESARYTASLVDAEE